MKKSFPFPEHIARSPVFEHGLIAAALFLALAASMMIAGTSLAAGYARLAEWLFA